MQIARIVGSGLPAIIAATTSSFKPRFKIVSIIPGMDALAPERTDTKQWVLQIAKFLSIELFHLLNAFHDLCHDLVVNLADHLRNTGYKPQL